MYTLLNNLNMYTANICKIKRRQCLSGRSPVYFSSLNAQNKEGSYSITINAVDSDSVKAQTITTLKFNSDFDQIEYDLSKNHPSRYRVLFT